MRLEEIMTGDEWRQLARLMYGSTWRALASYQQQRAAPVRSSVQQLAAKPIAVLKPQAVNKAKSLARKVKPAPYAPPPKPLPKPVPRDQPKVAAPTAYHPVKTTTPLPPTTRTSMASVQSSGQQQPSSKSTQQVMPQPPDMDQAGRRMLPVNKRGPNTVDLLTPIR